MTMQSVTILEEACVSAWKKDPAEGLIGVQ